MKATVAAIVIAGAIIFGSVLIANKPANSSNQRSGGSVENVSVENGKQIITLGVRGGYTPRITNAKANIPTTLRLVTNGTYDCSSVVQIPALGYRANLPQSGTAEVEIPAQTPGSSIRGMCIMGMYNFSLNFN